MLKPELYKRTVDILVDAYFNGVLEYTSCAKCAIGNIVAANLGVEPSWAETSQWANAINLGTGTIYPHAILGETLRQIQLTGYTAVEVARIEQAFFLGIHKRRHWDSKDEENFSGLMEVVKVIDCIHKNTNTILTTSTKNRFHKQLA